MLGVQPWCYNLELSCARQCSQAGSGTFWVLRQIPVIISKPVFWSAGYNFAKKGDFCNEGRSNILAMQHVLSALCQEEAKGAAAKIFMCAQKFFYLLRLSQKHQDSPGKKSPSSALPKS